MSGVTGPGGPGGPTWEPEAESVQQPPETQDAAETAPTTSRSGALPAEPRDPAAQALLRKLEDAKNLDIPLDPRGRPVPEYNYRLYDDASNVKKLGERSQVDEYGESFVLATVEIDAHQIAGPVPDASVLAKIDCGRRSIGYVWFHDAIDTVWRYLLF